MAQKLVSLTLILMLAAAAMAQQDSTEAVVKIAQDWLRASHAGDKASLNRITDPQMIATTPAGDVVAKARLIPDDDKPVQRLPEFAVQAPMVRTFGSTAVLMCRLHSDGGPGDFNATFVFINSSGQWKLAALQLSPQK